MNVGRPGGDRKDGEVPRRYDSPRRRAQAEATRAAIATAAAELFAANGWAGTTVRGVAGAAGVSEQTVYAVYGSKAGLANAVVDAATAVADSEQQAADLTAAQGDPVRELAAMIGFDRRLYERSGGVLAALRDAGRAQPELAEAYATGRAAADELRHRVVAAWPHGALRAGVREGDAVDVYAALCNIDVYRVFTLERRWSPDRVEQWLHHTLCELLLA